MPEQECTGSAEEEEDGSNGEEAGSADEPDSSEEEEEYVPPPASSTSSTLSTIKTAGFDEEQFMKNGPRQQGTIKIDRSKLQTVVTICSPTLLQMAVYDDVDLASVQKYDQSSDAWFSVIPGSAAPTVCITRPNSKSVWTMLLRFRYVFCIAILAPDPPAHAQIMFFGTHLIKNMMS